VNIYDISRNAVFEGSFDILLAITDVFLKLIYTLFGLYVWELFITCDFEWSLITRRREFRWPLASVLVELVIYFTDSQIRVRGLYQRINLIELMHFIVFFFLCRYFMTLSLQLGCVLSYSRYCILLAIIGL
jgi:hypothetical protein